jgi:hypothetical protein
VVVAFAAYLAVAVYGCTAINDGLQLRKTARYDSYSIPFYDFTDKYLNSFAYRPMDGFRSVKIVKSYLTFTGNKNDRLCVRFWSHAVSVYFICISQLPNNFVRHLHTFMNFHVKTEA